jgi:hypothetical protein
LPDLALVKHLAAAPGGSHQGRAARTSMLRGLKRLRWALRQARKAAQDGAAIEE